MQYLVWADFKCKVWRYSIYYFVLCPRDFRSTSLDTQTVTKYKHKAWICKVNYQLM